MSSPKWLHTDTTLAFNFHKIAGGMFLIYCSLLRRRLDGAAKQEEFFCKRGFTGIRVRDDGKGFAFIDLVDVFHVHWLSRLH